MTTNQDILAFLKADKEQREKEKDEEKAARQRERQEDMAKIADMIKDGVKNEVQTALKPLDDRVAGQEKRTEGLSEQIVKLLGDMEDLKSEVKASKEFPALPQPSGGSFARFVAGGGVTGDGAACDKEAGGVAAGITPVFRDLSGGSEARILDICARARRIIGFTPIEPRMIEMQKTAYGAKDTEEAMLMEIKSYLKCEMKVKPCDIEKIDIFKVFPPAKEEWNTLYVEFSSESEVDQLFRHTKVISKADHRLTRWIPKELYSRFRALESMAYKFRQDMRAQGSKVRTRVKVGRSDLEFSVKLPNAGWKAEPLPEGLPDIDLEAGRRSSLTSSPPPGRPSISCQDKKRPHSGSDSEETSKKQKEGTPEINLEGDDNSEEIQSDNNGKVDKLDKKGANQGRKELDLGEFTSTEGFSPATPAKTKNIPDLAVGINSPIFHTRTKKAQ